MPYDDKAKMRQWYLRNRVKVLAQTKARRDADPEKYRALSRAYARANKEEARWRNLFYNFGRMGFTKEWYQEKLLAQGNTCAICKKAAKLFVDHCRKTDKLRALLCHHCNSGIGLLRESPDIMRSAIEYVTRHAPEAGASYTFEPDEA